PGVGGELGRDRGERSEDLAMNTPELGQEPRPRAMERRLRLQAGRNRLARRARAGQQAPELVQAGAVRLDEMIDDFLDRPLARERAPGDRGGRKRPEERVERV